MKSFFKIFFATLTAIIVLKIVSIMIFMGIISAFTPEIKTVSQNSVLKIDFAESVVDSPTAPTFSISPSMEFDIVGNLSLLNVLGAIERAKTDDNIKGVYINPCMSSTGAIGNAQMEELRAALEDFKTSGKFIISYSEVYSQGFYWLASLSDEIFVNPEGMMDWRGLGAQVMFYKGMLDKLGVNVEILRHGTFKSAVEPFMTDKMSPANRLQTQTMVNSMWDVLLEDISKSRNISKENLSKYANTLALASPLDAKELGFVDSLLYEDQVLSYLAQQAGRSGCTHDVPSIITLGEYVSQTALSSKRISKNKIAIVYADGSIIDGESVVGSIGGATVSNLLARARYDEGVKAVVFRVNSPGGSALASEVMWREVELLRAEKPVIVSMGNYAASGGYYIAAPADIILTNRTTLTGSIGVFGMLLNAGQTLKDNVGLTVDVVKTSPYADMGSMFRPLEQTERDYLMKSVKNVYNTFVGHVAAGRNLTFEEVDAIGQGRVWCGVDAIEIGLADGLGGFNKAINLAAERAGVLEDFRVVEILDEGDELMALFNSFSGAKAKQMKERALMGEAYNYYNTIQNLMDSKGVLARMPYDITVK